MPRRGYRFVAEEITNKILPRRGYPPVERSTATPDGQAYWIRVTPTGQNTFHIHFLQSGNPYGAKKNAINMSSKMWYTVGQREEAFHFF